MKIQTVFISLFVGLVLVGCQIKTASDYYGQGPIKLSTNVIRGFERYKATSGPEYFTISVDGVGYSWSECPAGPSACRGGGLPEQVALQSCERRTKAKCKIYAVGKRVVWDGPVNTGYRVAVSPATKPADVVCGYSVDYSGEHPKWRVADEYQKYVAEAKRRGFSVDDCDELN